MTDDRTVLITGATGKQGGATARALADSGFKIRAMTRKPDSDAARAVAADTGADIVEGDLDKPESLKEALRGVWGVFSVQNTRDAGVAGEEEQGKRMATLAREAGVQHYVYTSVASANRQTGIPHFENKSRIEDTIRGLKFPSHVILRPVFFMENFPAMLKGEALYAALAPTTSVQVIAVEDIGRYAALAFTDSQKMAGQEIDIAGDAVTMPQAAAALNKWLGRPIQFVSVPIDDLRKNSEDLALMFEWFERVGYDVNIGGNERKYGIHPIALNTWAAQL